MESEKTPRQNRVREALGRIYEHHPPYFREYLRRYQEDPKSRVFAPLAEAYRKMGRVDEAIEICREGLDHHPDFHGGRVTLAKCFLERKRYAEARAELEKVVKYVPENLLAQRLLGDTYYQLGIRSQALHCYKMALLLSPEDVALAEKVHALESNTEPASAASATGPNISGEPEGFEDERIEAEVEEQIRQAKAEKKEALKPKVEIKEDELVDKVSALWEEEEDDSQNRLTDTGELIGVSQVLSSQKPSEEVGGLESIFGKDDENEEAFAIQHVSHVFMEADQPKKTEITTETLGDLYFSQGQFDKALKIFERLWEKNHTNELTRKINACRMKMGVEKQALVRNRQIEVLKTVLKKVKE